jgi:hypothetical protein
MYTFKTFTKYITNLKKNYFPPPGYGWRVEYMWTEGTKEAELWLP